MLPQAVAVLSLFSLLMMRVVCSTLHMGHIMINSDLVPYKNIKSPKKHSCKGEKKHLFIFFLIIFFLLEHRQHMVFA